MKYVSANVNYSGKFEWLQLILILLEIKRPRKYQVLVIYLWILKAATFL